MVAELVGRTGSGKVGIEKYVDYQMFTLRLLIEFAHSGATEVYHHRRQDIL